jgi:hypothetical protein
LCSFKGPSGSDEAEYDSWQLNDAFGGFTLEANGVKDAVPVAAEVVDLGIPMLLLRLPSGYLPFEPSRLLKSSGSFLGNRLTTLLETPCKLGTKKARMAGISR